MHLTMDSKLCTPYVAVSEFYTRTAKILGKCPVSDYYLELCDLSVRGRNFPIIARSLLPVPIVMQKLYNKFIIAIPTVWQYGEISVLDLGILPPFGRADTVDLERNISLYMIALQVI